jgi:hypothetical protein
MVTKEGIRKRERKIIPIAVSYECLHNKGMKNKTLDLNKELEIITFKNDEEFNNCWVYASECVVWEEDTYIFLDEYKVCIVPNKKVKKIVENIIKRVREGWRP